MSWINITMSLGCLDYIAKKLSDLVNPALTNWSLSLGGRTDQPAWLGFFPIHASVDRDFHISSLATLVIMAQIFNYRPDIVKLMDIVRCKPNFDWNYCWQHKMLSSMAVYRFFLPASWALVIVNPLMSWFTHVKALG